MVLRGHKRAVSDSMMQIGKERSPSREGSKKRGKGQRDFYLVGETKQSGKINGPWYYSYNKEDRSLTGICHLLSLAAGFSPKTFDR